MFRAVLLELMAKLASNDVRYGGVLEGFRDVLVADATVVKLHRLLARRFLGTRKNWELSGKLANPLAPTRIDAIMLAIVSGRQDMSKSGPGWADREGLSIVDLFKMFPDDAMAEAWFEEQRWPSPHISPEARRALNLAADGRHHAYREASAAQSGCVAWLRGR